LTFFHFLIIGLEGLYSHTTLWHTSYECSAPSSKLSLANGSCSCSTNATEKQALQRLKNGTLGSLAHSCPCRSTIGLSSFRPGLKPRKIPLQWHLLSVCIFFVSSSINNKAIAFAIPIPVHMIFRSGSLVANLICSYTFLGKRHTRKQVFSVILVTAGIALVTLAPYLQAKVPADKSTVAVTDADSRPEVMMIGIAMLMVSLFMSALLGIIQEHIYHKYGKEPRELMFYTHFLGLPFFLFLASDIQFHLDKWNTSPPLSSLLTWLPVPRMWIFMFFNVLTQWICIRGVFILTGLTSSLTTQLILSIRKLSSLLFSVLYFNRSLFTWFHWGGALLVTIGSFLYSIPDQYLKKKEHVS